MVQSNRIWLNLDAGDEESSPPPVRGLLIRRGAAGSQPGLRQDPYKVGLVIEGGGMRGVVAGGMVAALEGLGLTNTFDVVCGSSAGAAAGAYFVAGQARLGTSIFYEDINNKRFIDVFRPLRFRAIMDIDFLIDIVMRTLKPLNTNRIVSSKTVLKIVTTDIDSGAGVVLNDFSSGDDVLEAMRASTRIPLIASAPIRIAGRRLTDGGLVAPIPIQVALDAGCTHLLVLLTRPPSTIKGTPTLLDRFVIGPLMHMILGGKSAGCYLQRPQLYKSALDLISASSEFFTKKIPSIAAIRLPSGSAGVQRLDTNYEILVRGAQDGMNSVFKFFGLQRDNIADVKLFHSRGESRTGNAGVASQ